MRALLDVNVIIALLDSGHFMHTSACTWLERNLDQGWATCPLTQTGVVRIMAQPAYPNTQPAQQVAARLAEALTIPAMPSGPSKSACSRRV
jgi:predicted nucleic acid-binding protein